MLPQAPPITLSFAIEEPTSCGTLQSKSHLTDAQRLKAIESYALIAASHAVSTQKSRQVREEQPTTRNSHPYLRISAPSNLNRLGSTQMEKPEKPQMPQSHKNQSSLRLSLRLQDTFRQYLRLRVPTQPDHAIDKERHRPSRELRRLFTIHDSAYCQS